jgi:hypothetical protein
MAIVKIAVATRNKMAQNIIDDLDAATGPSVLEFYTGVQPNGPDVAVTSQLKLGELICSDPCATKADGVITFAAITQDSDADNSGTATWARHRNGDGVAVVDYDVTDTAGNGAVKLTNVEVYSGGSILMDGLTITIGGA